MALRKLQILGEAVVFAAVFFLLRGYEFGVGNQTVFLPVIRALLGETHLYSDFGVATHIFYHYNFNHLMAFGSHIGGLPEAFLTAQILLLIALYLGIAYFKNSFFPRANALWPSILILFLWDQQGLDGNVLWVNRLEAQYLAWPFSLFALGFAARKKFAWAGLFSGFCFAIQFQIGFWTEIFVLLFALTEDRRIASCIQAGLFFLIPGLPVLIQHYPVIFQADLVWSNSFIDYATIRIPHHMQFDLRLVIVFSALTIACLTQKKAFKLALIVLCFGVLQYADYHFLKLGPIARMQPLRMSPIIYLTGVLSLSPFLLRLVDAPSRLQNALAVLILFIIGPRFVTFLSLKTHWFYPAIAIILIIGIPLWHGLNFFARRKKAVLVVVPSLILLIVSTFPPPFSFDIRRQQNNSWIELTSWIERNTDAGSLFIAPPHSQGFVFCANRSCVATFKSGTNHKKDIIQWTERLNDLTNGRFESCRGWNCLGALAKGYKSLRTEDILALSKKYRAKYFVAESGQHYPFKKAYENNQFTLYRIALPDAGPQIDVL